MIEGSVISARGLGKEYLITRRAGSLKEMIVRPSIGRKGNVPFKALDDVSFDLPPGRSLAIMGHNGSGKSTLLKLISGIMPQSTGELRVDGQVAALLELGAAFQDDFTGMENIFLQCSIFGMNRQEILERLDSIIDFSELARFIHTPVKKYSSGMFMRLAFAIALHLETRILVLDEILTVGDQAFQWKCRERIQRAKQKGRTIIFVSHVIEQVEMLADDVLWLDHGKVRGYGPAEELLPVYHKSALGGEFRENPQAERARASNAVPSGRFQSREARIINVSLQNAAGEEPTTFDPREEINLQVDVEVFEELPGLRLLIAVGTVDAVRATCSDSGTLLPGVKPGVYRINARVKSFQVKPGIYLVTLLLSHPDDRFVAWDFQVRMHAIAIRGDRGTIASGRVLPVGRFAVPDFTPPVAGA